MDEFLQILFCVSLLNSHTRSLQVCVYVPCVYICVLYIYYFVIQCEFVVCIYVDIIVFMVRRYAAGTQERGILMMLNS